MEFRLLGPLAVVVDGEPATPTGNRERSLLARLLLAPNRVVSVAQLVDDLWDDPPDKAQASLQVAVHKLRKLLGDGERIATQAPGYVLRVEEGELDTLRFEQLAAAGQSALLAGEPGRAAALLSDALALWTGEALGDLAGRRFAQLDAIRFEQARLSALEARIEADLLLGRHAAVLAELEALAATNPLHEGIWRALAVARYRSGRQADALRALQRLRTSLLDELGLDPSPATGALELEVLEHRLPDLEPATTAPAPPEPGRPAPRGLPRQSTPVIGRDREVAATVADLLEPGLVTLTGMAGVGKTRIARAAATELHRQLGAAVVFVDLTGDDRTGNGSGVLAEVAQAAGLPGDTDADSLATALDQRATLLLLDNCDDAVEATADLVDRLLDGAPGLRVLVTARERLRVGGERAARIFPLVTGAPTDPFDALAANPAVALFVDRAQRAQPAFEVTPANAPAVATICRHLEGLPLAICLAAARLRSIGLDELVERLDDCFGVLTGGDRSTVAHHRTLRSLLDATIGQLDPEEVRLLARLSVFDGGWTLAAAEAVAADPDLGPTQVLDGLGGLTDRSIVDHDPATGRYTMLRVVRDHVAGRLDEDPGATGVRSRHAAWLEQGP